MKNGRQMLGIFGIVVLVIFFIISSVNAKQFTFQWGRFKVEPGITYQGAYNNNIYADRENEEGDYVSTLTPSITMNYKGAPGDYFSAGYRLGLMAYHTNSNNNHQSHNPFLNFGIGTPSGFYINGDENFYRTSDIFGSEDDYNIGIKTKRWNNSAGLTCGYKFGKYGIEGTYRNNLQKYDEEIDQWQDKVDHQYGVSFFVNLTAKTSIFAQYRRTDSEYDKQNDGVLGWSESTSQDYTLNDYFGGIRFQPGGKLSGEIKVGYGTSEFDNDYDRNGWEYEDEDAWIAESSVSYRMRQRTSFNLRLHRSHRGSPDADAASYVRTSVGLGVNQVVTNRLSLNFNADWTDHSYSNERGEVPEKQFYIYTVNGSFSWTVVKWLSTGLGYQHTWKAATEEEYEDEEYDNGVFSVNADIHF